MNIRGSIICFLQDINNQDGQELKIHMVVLTDAKIQLTSIMVSKLLATCLLPMHQKLQGTTTRLHIAGALDSIPKPCLGADYYFFKPTLIRMGFKYVMFGCSGITCSFNCPWLVQLVLAPTFPNGSLLRCSWANNPEETIIFIKQSHFC